MAKAVFLDTEWTGPGLSLDGLKALPLDWQFYSSTASEERIPRLKDAVVAVSKNAPFPREFFAELPALRLLCIASTGVNQIDLEAAFEAGVTICNVPNYSTASVAQLTMLFILSLSTSCFGDVRNGYSRAFGNYPIREVQDKKLGIIGFGNIGRAVAKIASAFEMEILVAEHPGRSSNLDNGYPLSELLREIDYLSVHVPLTPLTENLISRKEIEQMKPSAYLINTSRGKIFNEADLADALKQKRIAGAALDVFSVEPPPPDHPLLDPSIPNLILTPHIGWASLEARTRLVQIVEQNIRSFLEGNPQNCLLAKHLLPVSEHLS